MKDKIEVKRSEHNLNKVTIKRNRLRLKVVYDLLKQAKYHYKEGGKYITEANRILALSKK